LQAEADAKGLITWDVSVGSTVARAHQHAAGARKKGHFRRGAFLGSYKIFVSVDRVVRLG
jgi:hypothetical protein